MKRNGAPFSAIPDCGTIDNRYAVSLSFLPVCPCNREDRSIGIGVHVASPLSAIGEYLAVHAEISRR